MICKICNAEIDDSAAFCINCGTPVEIEPVKPQPSPKPAAQPTYQQNAYQAYQQNTYQAYQQNAYQQDSYQQTYQQNAYQQDSYQQTYQQDAYQQTYAQDPYQQGYQQPYYAEKPAEDDLVHFTTVKQYLAWMFLGMIPFASFPLPILQIVLACIRGKEHKSRANFFAAQFAFLGIWLAIIIGLVILALIAGAILGAVGIAAFPAVIEFAEGFLGVNF